MNNIEIFMEKITKATQTILAVGITIAAFVLFYALLFKNIVDGTAKDIILFVLGCVSSNLTQIISYYFGSSKSSEEKNKYMSRSYERDNDGY
jgi:hypothetical protein